MDDINKDFGNYKKSEEYPAEEVSSYKDAVINPDKQELEVKFAGMRDLFTSILTENRKDYDKQVTEMKNVFSAVLEDNRKQFQTQIQDLYKTIPKILHESERQRRQSEFFFMDEELDLGQGNKKEKFTKITAIKELLLGKDNKELKARLEDLYQELEENNKQEQEALESIVDEIHARLIRMEKKVLEEVEKVQMQLRVELNSVVQNQANKQDVFRLFRYVSEQTRITNNNSNK